MKRKSENQSIQPRLKQPPIIYSQNRLIKAKNIKGYFKCPHEIREIEEYAFDRCTKLTQIDLSQEIVKIGKCAFIRCHNLIHINLPEEITEIKECTFIYCGSLTHITLPEKIKTIGYGAFDSCRNLIHITLPKEIEFIARDAFFCCLALKFIIIPDNDEQNLQRIRTLLPPHLKNKVISQDFFLRWQLNAKEALLSQGIVSDVAKLICNRGGLTFFNTVPATISQIIKNSQSPENLNLYQINFPI